MSIFKHLFKSTGANQKADLQTTQAQSTANHICRVYFSCPICGYWYDTETSEENPAVYRGCIRCGYSGTGPANIEEINSRIAKFDLREYNSRRDIMEMIHQCASEEEFNREISDKIKYYDNETAEKNSFSQRLTDFHEKQKKEMYEAITDFKGNCTTYEEMKEKVETLKKQEDEKLIRRWEEEKNQARFDKKDLKRKGIKTI